MCLVDFSLIDVVLNLWYGFCNYKEIYYGWGIFDLINFDIKLLVKLNFDKWKKNNLVYVYRIIVLKIKGWMCILFNII